LALFISNIGFNRLLLVNDFLHTAIQEVVERSEMVFCEPFVGEVLA